MNKEELKEALKQMLKSGEITILVDNRERLDIGVETTVTIVIDAEHYSCTS